MSNLSLEPRSRRSVLRSMGAVGVGASLVGEASARGSDTERRIVGAETKRAAEQVKRRADVVVDELDFGDVGHAVVGEFPAESHVELETRSAVRYVEEESEVRLLGESDEDLDETQLVPWGVEEIGAQQLHEEGTTGAGAHIAIIDSGIDSDHPDLQPNLGEGLAVVSCDGDCRRDWDDDHNHGTHVAGIADATSNEVGVVGVSTDAVLHSVKVMSADGTGDTSTIARGIKWAADEGHDVANMSIGSTSPSQVMHDAVKYAHERGVLLVAAAGNESPSEHEVHYPGAFPEVVCVGATSKDGDMYENSLAGDPVELVAPGDEVQSTVRGGYESYSGTSMATPHVTGAAALLLGEGYATDEVRQLLRDTATDLGHDDEEQGHGLVDPVAALDRDKDDGPGATLGVTNHGATAVEGRSATLNGELLGLPDGSSATVGFEYWVAGQRRLTTLAVESGERTSEGAFSATVENLDPETTYGFRAYADDGDDRVTSRTDTFTTVEEGPERSVVVETATPTDVEDDEAELRGRVTELRGVSQVRAYFEYWVAGDRDATRVRVPVDDVDEPEEFDEDAEDLEGGTTYAVRAQCVADDGTTYAGDVVEFETRGSPDDGADAAVTVRTLGATDVEDDEAELVGRVTELRGVEEARVYFEYWVRGEEDATNVRVPVDVVDEPGEFDEDAEDLRSETTYVARAECVAGDTVASGDAVEFTTRAD